MNRKTIILLIAVIFLISTFNGILSAEDVKIPKKALKFEKKGDKATKKKEYDKAMELYKQALEIHPDMDTVHYKIASIHAFRKNYKEALKELNITLKLNINNENAKKNLIDITFRYVDSLYREKKKEDANNLLLELISTKGMEDIDNKILTELYYKIGVNYFQLQKLNESNEYLLKFVNAVDSNILFPKVYPSATYLIGVIYAQLNDIDNSNKYLLKYVELKKEFPNDTYVVIAKYLIGDNNFKNLKKNISEIEKTKKKLGSKQIKQINKLNDKILNLAKAENGIEENLLFAIEKKPELEHPYVLLGNFYYLKKDLNNSIKYYKLLIEKFPGSSDIEVYKVFLKDIVREKKQK